MTRTNSYDVIVTTNNRAESVDILVEQILKQNRLPENIIVVDSSEKENLSLQETQDVYYIRSSHANQPYQRYVGYLASKSPLLVYLDDDMELVGNNVFEKVTNAFNKEETIGLALNFINNNEFLNQKVPKSKFAETKGASKKIVNILKKLSGQLELKHGKYSYNGLKGKQPLEGGQTQWFSGGAFAIKRKFLYKNFNFKLFDLYEKQLGKGEDGIIGYTASKAGALNFEPEILFLHNDKQDSTYSKSFYSFSRRVIFSRLYLSYEFCRLDGRSQRIVPLLYHWYVFWRIAGILVNQLLGFRESRHQMLKGYLSGWWLAWKYGNELRQCNDGTYWKKEAKHDIES